MDLPRRVVEVIQRELPDVELGGAELLGEGWNATAWRLHGRSTDWVVRVPKLDWAGEEIERQTCLGLHLAGVGLPVPLGWRVLRGSSGGVIAGIYEYVPGREAPKAGRRELNLLGIELAAFLGRLHSAPTGVAVRDCNAIVLDPWAGRYQDIIETYAPMAGRQTQSWLKRAGGRLQRSLASCDERVLLHGDLAPEHVICAGDGRVRAVLDFSGPQVSDAAIDFGRLVQRWGAGFAKSVLGRYGRPVDAGFEERMVLYARLEPLRTIEAGVRRELPEWIAWGRKWLAVYASADRRAGW